MNDILEMRIGVILGILNERINQMPDSNKKAEEEVIHGDANLLMKM